jgi:hypothetical protein
MKNNQIFYFYLFYKESKINNFNFYLSLTFENFLLARTMSVLTPEIVESVDSPSEANKKKTRNKGQSTLTVGPYV